jgi:hypothetical protein
LSKNIGRQGAILSGCGEPAHRDGKAALFVDAFDLILDGTRNNFFEESHHF